MWKLICVALLVGTVTGTPLNSTGLLAVTNQDLSARYRLSGIVRPSYYDVEQFFNPDDDTGFHGSVMIRIIATESVQQITLHAMEIEIVGTIRVLLASPVGTPTNLYSSHTMTDDDRHFLTINLSASLQVATPYEVHIDFQGKYAENMFGVYISNYEYENQPRRLITSQLQPTFARRSFPCFDEPQLKAEFRKTIYAPYSYTTVRSNMPLRDPADMDKPDVPNYKKHEFRTTKMMSTYLLAYLISNFDHLDNVDSSIFRLPFKVFSRPGTLQNGEFAMQYGQENMVALEEWTDFPYSFPKLDKVAVPDFAAGAMENWGLVIYRETALLYEPGVTSTSALQGVGRIITHENMHMWFGNEVSPMSWTYTWLNEGFANYFESFGTDMVRPDWRMLDQYVIAMQNVFHADAVLGVNPMTFPVYTPSQILGTFNAVAYQKSGSVIRMMQHFLTPPVFQAGLRHYLRTHTGSAVTPEDMYESMQYALDNSEHILPYRVQTIMERWANQGGFPVVTVRRSAPGANSLIVSQERFLTDSSQSSPYRWHIPINWVLSSDPDFSDTSPQRWIPSSFPAVAIDLPGLQDEDWFIVNKQQTGYYRVNYNLDNWVALSNLLNKEDASLEVINLLNRAQLIDDALNLARNGRLNYPVALDLVMFVRKETDYIPWAAANAAFSYLDTVLSRTPMYYTFQQILLRLTEGVYEKLGFDSADNEEHVTAFFRNIILSLNCRYGNEDCNNKAEELLQEFRQGTPINSNIQTTVFCSSLRGGSAENFDFLWGKYTESTDSSQQSIYLNALGCTSNVEKRTFFLNQVIADDSKVREQDRHTVIVAVTNAGPENSDAALVFVFENFLKIQPVVQGLTGTTNILNAFSRTLTIQQHLDMILEFRERYEGNLTDGEIASITGIEQNIQASISWRRRHYDPVYHWLRANNASSLTAGLTILIAFLVTLIRV